MGARYSVATSKGGANIRGIAGLRSTTGSLARGKVYDYVVACAATPADAVFVHQLANYSTAPTGANPTPAPLDPADVAALATGDGTITGFVEVEVRGMLSGSGFWFRRFQIAPFQQIAIPMETFSDLRIDVVGATAVNFDVTAFASEDLLILEKGSRVFLPQLDTGVT
ncbi:hypothetical protein LCGC14_2159860, partial [marine sediment metagenome]